MVCAAESNGSNAAFAMHEQYSSMPMRMPNSTANRNPTVPSQLLKIFAPAYDVNPDAPGVILKSQLGIESKQRSSISSYRHGLGGRGKLQCHITGRAILDVADFLRRRRGVAGNRIHLVMVDHRVHGTDTPAKAIHAEYNQRDYQQQHRTGWPSSWSPAAPRPTPFTRWMRTAT